MITPAPILAPAAVLVAWSLLVMMWMIVTRFPGIKRAGLGARATQAGMRYQDIEPDIEDRVNWKSHNYTHLMEQPTLFYATVAILALAGAGTGFNVTLAWLYVGLRIAHSLWQGMVNTLPLRIMLFALSSTVLIIMGVNAVLATLG